MATTFLHRATEELGLITLWLSSRDTKLLYAQRFVRMFAYGGSTLILVAYLASFNYTRSEIGAFHSLTLAGDVVISLILTVFADAVRRRAVLALGALLLSGSGIVFALSENYWILLASAILGVISPSGNEIGPFRAIEESILAQLTEKRRRSDIYAWYALLGQAGVACGMMISGWSINYMRRELAWQITKAYKSVFWGYAVLGLLNFGLALSLSKTVEAPGQIVAAVDNESTPLLGNEIEDSELRKPKFMSMLPQIAPESRAIVLSISILFALDSFSSGLVPMSWITFFFQTKFDLMEGKLGTLFFLTSGTTALSMLVAASIAKRIGNIRTMVFTHLPSSIFLALIPVPNSVSLAMLFLGLRASTASMDTAPRSAFVAAVIRENERTAVIGFTNVVKTMAQSLGPMVTGTLAGKKLFWLSFLIAGSLKVTYDLGILAIFANHESIEDRDGNEETTEEEASSPGNAALYRNQHGR
ncbi:major facilitator superfamily domain-containing protein [Bisporella sp. PMI_857]|nr:major facilitator superfamily domain-containing protein [Bisporella sp. PMI_857]